MSFLLDTNIVSELRRGPRANAGVVAWFEEQPNAALFLSVLSLGEIHQGIARLRKRDPKQAAHLSRWVHGLSQFYEDRLLYIDGPVAEDWGRLSAARSLPVVDGLLAATARVHRLTLVTRNTRDFAHVDVPVFNPYAPN